MDRFNSSQDDRTTVERRATLVEKTVIRPASVERLREIRD
jgi:hypothetical protein